ncbi:GNAT family N-acetyltransferase [Nibricoccus sp. IMCC34717]|uniref:GNAT family N-acetyltransferase n=1 Tax=Nibricoccus sp. IMCC34717 TaxID=3034021 RepID=UPI00384DCA83
MLKHANLICTAWDRDMLIGVARSVTDYSFCCYLSDLAVDVAYQRSGVGIRLIQETQSSLGSNCKLILLAAPNARAYYPKIGFAPHDSAWVIEARYPAKCARK